VIESGDLAAIVDVLDQLSQELADGAGLERLVQLRKLMVDVTAMDKRVTEQITALMTEQLEGQPRVVEGERWKVKDNFALTFDHTEVARRIIQRVRTNDETGEIIASGEAVDLAGRALRAFMTLYLSASAEPKRAALKSILGVEDAKASGLASWRKTGSKIVSDPVPKMEEL
jgi:hypothetical protein